MKKVITIVLLFIYSYSFPGLTSIEDANQLVTRFERILNDLKSNDPMKYSILLRLADALSARSQIKNAEQTSKGGASKSGAFKGCTRCQAGHADMKRALSIYKSIQNRVPTNMKGHVVFQIGYLNSLLGDQRAATNAYRRIIRNPKIKDLKPKSYIALGELFYKRNRFRESKNYFLEALKLNFPNKGFIIYRIAWCDYHIGRIGLAVNHLFRLLKSPDVFLLKEGDRKKIDSSFHQEVSKDLATFLAKKDPQNKEIELLYQLSPEDQRMDNIIYLAKELFRLGNKRKAILVWDKVRLRQPHAIDQLEAYVWLFQLFIEMDQPKDVIRTIKAISKIWNSANCPQNERCQQFKNRVRQNMMSWQKENRSNFQSSILKTYLNYLDLFKNDIEMTYQTGSVAKKLQLWQLSIKLHRAAIQMQTEKYLLDGISQEEKKKAAHLLENILLHYIEVAQLSKNLEWLQKAYETYLSQGKNQFLKVAFLRAKLFYDQKHYEKAADAFRSIVFIKTKDLQVVNPQVIDSQVVDSQASKIKLQAAHLTINAFVLAKNDAQLEKVSLEFMNEFPDQASYFMKVNRTSIINQALAVSKDPQLAWQILGRINLLNADDNEKVKYYKNKIVLAGQLHQVSDEIQLIEQLLKVKSLSKSDMKFALVRKLYLAELMLDFSTMYEVSQKLNFEKLTPDQRAFRMALFAELAQKDYIPYYHNFLKLSDNTKKKFDVALRLLKESSDQESFLQRYQKILLHNPVIFANALLEDYINKKNKNLVGKFLKEKHFMNTDAGKAVWRDEFLKNLSTIAKQISQHHIRTENPKFIENDLKKRLQLFINLEKKALEAISMKDIISQVITLSLVKDEAQRLHNDLMLISFELLTSSKQRFLSALKQQAQSYQKKAMDIDSQLNKLFQDVEFFDKLEGHFERVSKPVQIISKPHLSLFTNYLLEKDRPRIRVILSNMNDKIEDQKTQMKQDHDLVIKALQEEIRKNPYDREKVEELIALEEMRGHKTMVLYLKERRLVMVNEDSK